MTLQLGLEDLLAELRHARRTGDLGRLALIAYCEVRRWAREAGERELAEQASAMVTDGPLASREQFLQRIDGLMLALEQRREPPPALAPALLLPLGQGGCNPGGAAAG